MSAPRASRGAWTALPFTGPAPKSTLNHSSVLTSKLTLMVMGGETISASTPLPDHHLYRARKWAPSKRHNAPPGISSHSSVAWGAKMMTFGGRTPTGTTNEMNVYNEETSSWSRARQNGDVPCAREFHSLNLVGLRLAEGAHVSSESNAQALVVFGGITTEGLGSDFYFMSLETVDMRWRKLSFAEDSAPCARSHHSATAVGSKLYIFGGRDANGTILDDLWCIDFSGQTPQCQQVQKNTTSWPAARYHHASAPLASQSAFILTGGKNSQESSPDNFAWVWETKKQEWRSFPLGLAPRYGHSMTSMSGTTVCLIGGAILSDGQEADSSSIAASANTAFEALTRTFVLDESSARDDLTSISSSSDFSSDPRRKRGDSITRGRERKNSGIRTMRASMAPSIAVPRNASLSSAPPNAALPALPLSQRLPGPAKASPSISPRNNGPVSPRGSPVSPRSAPPNKPLPLARPQTMTAAMRTAFELDKLTLAAQELNSPFEDAQVLLRSPRDASRPANDEFTVSGAYIPAGGATNAVPPSRSLPPTPANSMPRSSSLYASPMPFSNPPHAPASSVPYSVASNGAPRSVGHLPASTAPGPLAAVKKANSRMRSARISAHPATTTSSTPIKPGNAEWIDYMDPEQLKSELKAMTHFIHTVKAVIDRDTQYGASTETLNAVKQLYANEMPKLTEPPASRMAQSNASISYNPNSQYSGYSGLSSSQPASQNSSTQSPTSMRFASALKSDESVSTPNSNSLSPRGEGNRLTQSSGNGITNSQNSSVPHSAPMPIAGAHQHSQTTNTSFIASSPGGSGKLWGATTSPSPGSFRDRDAYLSHRPSMLTSSSGGAVVIGPSSPPVSTEPLRIGSRGSIVMGASPFVDANATTSTTSSSPSNGTSYMDAAGGTRTNTPSPNPNGVSLTSSSSNLSKSTSTESLASKRSTIVVKEFDLTSTADKQAAMLESQLDASYAIPTTSCPDSEQSRKDREFAVRELLDTESKYVRDLNLIVEQFQKPLQANNILNARQISEIFSTIKDFIPLHEQLLKELSETIQKPDADQCPGQIFLAMADYLKMYTGFCASQTNIAQRISDLAKANSAFRKFLDAKLKDEKMRGLTLTAFLVMPIQRVCRFPLLLKQIAKSTPVSHQDFKKLHLGIFKVDKVVLAVNEGKRLLEAQAQMYELEQNLTWEKQKAPNNFVFIDPSRRLITQDTNVEWLSPSSKEKSEAVHILLFNDLIIVARPKEGTSNRKIRRIYALAITNVGLDDALDSSTGKSTLQVGFGDEVMNLAFSSKEKRNEMQMAIADTKGKMPDSNAVRDTIRALEVYHAQSS